MDQITLDRSFNLHREFAFSTGLNPYTEEEDCRLTDAYIEWLEKRAAGNMEPVAKQGAKLAGVAQTTEQSTPCKDIACAVNKDGICVGALRHCYKRQL